MNKHDIAMEVLRRARDGYRDAEYRDACGYAMEVLAAIGGLEDADWVVLYHCATTLEHNQTPWARLWEIREIVGKILDARSETAP